jgi:hypothetical protein
LVLGDFLIRRPAARETVLAGSESARGSS